MRKYMSGFVCLCLILSFFLNVSTACGATYRDLPASHWAYNSIEYLTEKNIVAGDGNGKFRPNASVTRAEFIKMMTSAFGLKKEKAVSYKNVPEWAQKYIRAAAAQGFLFNYKDETNFSEGLQRQEAVGLLMRYIGLSSSGNFDTGTIKDFSSIHTAYREYVISAIENDIVEGYEDGSFKPLRVLTRAEALSLLYHATGSIYNTSASENDRDGSEKNATINESVTLTGLKLTGNVNITEGVKFLSMTNCTVDGTLYVRAGTYLNISMCSINKIVTLADDSTISLNSSSSVERIEPKKTTTITVNNDCKVTTVLCREGADGSAISGIGEIKNFGTYCNDTVCNMEPENYFIDEGCTAVINGISFGPGSGVYTSFAVRNIKVYENERKITISGQPVTDGTLYAAVWMDNEQAWTIEKVIAQSLGIKTIKDEPVNISLDIKCSADYYVAGLVFVPDNAAAQKEIVYGITGDSGSFVFSVNAPAAKSIEEPSMQINLADGMIELDFDQKMFAKAENGTMIEPDALDFIESISVEKLGENIQKIPDNAYVVEKDSKTGSTKIFVYLNDGIEANARYILSVSQNLMSVYSMPLGTCDYTTVYSEKASVIRPYITPDKKILGHNEEICVIVPKFVDSVYYVYTVNGKDPQFETTVDGNAQISFSTFSENTIIDIEAHAVSSNGVMIGKSAQSRFIVNPAAIIEVGGIQYTGVNNIHLSNPTFVRAFIPEILISEGYELHIYADGIETNSAITVTEPVTLNAILMYDGKLAAQTSVIFN